MKRKRKRQPSLFEQEQDVLWFLLRNGTKQHVSRRYALLLCHCDLLSQRLDELAEEERNKEEECKNDQVPSDR